MTKQLEEYLKKQIAAGADMEMTIAHLGTLGWKKEQIDLAMESIRGTPKGTYSVNEMLPKKTAALEVYKVHQFNKNMSIISMCMVFVIAIASRTTGPYGNWFVAGSTGVFCMLYAFILWRDLNRMKYLKSEYGLLVK